MTAPVDRPRRVWSRHIAAWRRERKELGSVRAGLLRLRDGFGVVEVNRWIAENAPRLDEMERALRAAEARTVELESTVRTHHEHASRQLEALTHGLTTHARELQVANFMAWLELTVPETKTTVSVVLPSRNRVQWIGSAIASVIAQSHEHWELLVVNDGSTDGTVELLQGIDDPRIRVHTTDGVGVCAARNVALAHATGDVVTYLDDDNVMHPQWLRAITWAFERHADVDVVYGARVIDDEDLVHGRGPGGLPFLHWLPFDRARLEQHNIVDMNVIAHRREVAAASFDETLSILGDWDLFLRLTEAKPPMELPAFACVYRTDAHDRLSGGPSLFAERDHIYAKLRGAPTTPSTHERASS